MIDQITRKSEIKSRLSGLLDAKTLASLPVSRRQQEERWRAFGQAMLVLGVFILVAGLYLPDLTGRSIFLFGALLYAGVGAFSIDRAKKISLKKMS
jgi:uncharacterized membrane protein YiaA